VNGKYQIDIIILFSQRSCSFVFYAFKNFWVEKYLGLERTGRGLLLNRRLIRYPEIVFEARGDSDAGRS